MVEKAAKLDRKPIPGFVTRKGGQWFVGDCFIDGNGKNGFCYQYVGVDGANLRICGIQKITPQSLDGSYGHDISGTNAEAEVQWHDTHGFERWTPIWDTTGALYFVKNDPMADEQVVQKPEPKQTKPLSEGEELFLFFKKRNHD